jgi:hypothetical protein
MVTLADMKAEIGLDPLDAADDARASAALAAAVDYCNQVRPDHDWRNPAPRQKRGLLLLAVHLFERAGATGEEQNAGYEFGSPQLVGRHVQELIGIGRHFPPVVA